MSEFEGIVGMQVDHMLEGISIDLERRRKDMLDKAERDAAALLRRVRSRNLKNFSLALAEERRVAELAVQKERAAQATVARQFSHGRDRERLVQGRQQLRHELLERWREEQARKQWISALIGEAADVVERGQWTIEHPHDLPEVDVSGVSKVAADVAGGQPELVPIENLAAGLRIRQKGAVLDASLDGLLAHKDAIDGLLLSQMKELAEDGEVGENRGD